MIWRILQQIMLLGGMCTLLLGCASISRGITEGIMGNPDEVKDTRMCKIEGPAFEGIQTLIQKQDLTASVSKNAERRPTTKLLMIHGIGTHHPGYSSRFAENLTRALNLTVTQEQVKEIDLHDSRSAPGKDLGHLKIHRFFDRAQTRELLFYELTWSAITEAQKQAIAYDNSGEYSYRRANLNDSMKVFLNNHISDPLLYAGTLRELMLLSVIQASCWMNYGEWDQYPDYTDQSCSTSKSPEYARQLAEDDIIIVTHSLGSRIAVDAWEYAVEKIHSAEAQQVLEGKGYYGPEEIRNVRLYLDVFKQKTLPLYMLANQLPLLQLGRERPEVTGKSDQYCKPEGSHYTQRLFKELRIVAFSDPNDLFSYAIPPKFADENMDSRLCPRITNVVLNVAPVNNLFGIGEIANPLIAHSGYDNDERVIGLIAQGISHDHVDPIVQDRCTWLEMVEK